MHNLAIVIPCYNEASKIKQTFQVYFNYFSDSAYFKYKKIAIVLVNDGSQDETGEIIKKLENYSNDRILVRAINFKQNKGKGAAIKQGCLAVESEIYGFVDADLSFQPELTEKAVLFLNKFDLVAGERIDDKKYSGYLKLRMVISKFFRKKINLFFSLLNIDTQCGFKFFKNTVAKNILPQIKHNRFSFDIELIILLRQANFKIKSFPVHFKHQDKSSIIWRDGIRYILDTMSISERFKSGESKKLFFKIFVLSLILSFSVYGWVIFKGFLFSDDFTWLWYGQQINNSLENMMSFRMSTFYSPVMNAFYSIMYYLFYYNPQPLFFVGILVHAFVTFLSGIFAWQLSKSKLIAIFVSFLTAFAGGAYEPLVWIGANMHSFVTFFILSCLICHYQYLLRKKNIYLIGSFIFLILALGTKESAIIIPALLFISLIYYVLSHKKIFSKELLIFWISTVILSGVYLYNQFLWQKNSIWVQSGVWDINLVSFLRIPLIIFDNFIPISFLRLHLITPSAIFLWIFSTVFLIFILYKFRKLKLVWFGFFWLLISISPFIFFSTQFWWEPLASRYNYLPRIGAIIIITAILQYIITNNRARYVISSLAYLVILIIIAQLYFMTATIRAEYLYVYNTGRTLVQAMHKIDNINPNKIFVRWDRPFNENIAHIVGAASIIANIKEEDIIFLKKDEEEIIDNKNILLYWNHGIKKYEVK